MSKRPPEQGLQTMSYTKSFDKVRNGVALTTSRGSSNCFAATRGMNPPKRACDMQATAVWDLVGAGLQPLLRVSNALIPGSLRTRPGTAKLPCPPPPQPETSLADLDAILKRLDGAKQQWVKVGTKERQQLLHQCTANFISICHEIAQASAIAKGSYESGLGDEM